MTATAELARARVRELTKKFYPRKPAAGVVAYLESKVDAQEPAFERHDVIEPTPAPVLRITSLDYRINSAGMEPSLAFIIRAVSEETGVSHLELISHRRPQRITRARQMVSYIAARRTSQSLPEIGRRLGGKDHTTILHGRDATARRLEAGDDELSAVVSAVMEKIDEMLASVQAARA